MGAGKLYGAFVLGGNYFNVLALNVTIPSTFAFGGGWLVPYTFGQSQLGFDAPTTATTLAIPLTVRAWRECCATALR